MDTVNFKDLSPDEYKKETSDKWTDTPCGSNYTNKEFLSKEYFDEIEFHRYETHPWIREAIDSFDLKGKKVLEIGFGMGSDHLSLARRGAFMNGIDLTPSHVEITKARLNIFGEVSNLVNGDAELLPYKNESFDFVYSLGVIHHSPDTEKIISEIHRVLKPGGGCYIAVYHKNSLFFWWSVFLVNYLIKRAWLKRTLKQQISLIEYPGTNENLVIKLYKRKEFADLFYRYKRVNSCVKHLIPIDIAYFSKYFKEPQKPTPLLTKIASKLGWYVIVEAKK